MSEKYNIPEEHSLDSMEVSENIDNFKPSRSLENPEIEEMVMKKVEDIFHEKTAFHHLTFREQFKEKNITTNSIHTAHDVVILLDTISENLEKLFATGLMGDSHINDGKITGDKYKKSIKDHIIHRTERGLYSEGQDKKPSVFFHIFGRVIDPVDNPLNNTRDLDKWLGTDMWNSGLTILFDTPENESFGSKKTDSEQPPIYPKIKIGEYSLSMGGQEARIIANLRYKYPDIKPNDPRILDFLKDAKKDMSDERYKSFKKFFTAEGKTKTSSTEGFRTPLRVAPRKFKGFVVNMEFLEKRGVVFKEDLIDQNEKISEDELSARFFRFLEKLKKHEIDFKFRSENIIRMLVNIMKKTNTFIPIYDENGNLLWPENKLHEDIVATSKSE